MNKAIAALSSERFLQKLRLASGLVMLAFLVMHFVNHAALLVSLETADRLRRPFSALWQNPVGSALLYAALLVHVSLGLHGLYRRRTLRMPAREAAQILLGLLIPFVIIEHVVSARLGTNVDYRAVVTGLWVTDPLSGLRQSVALVVIWAHACIGMHFWLRFRNWYGTAAPYLMTVAILVPVLALLGFADAGRILAHSPLAAPPILDRDSLPAIARAALSDAGAIAEDRIAQVKRALYLLFAGAIALVFLLRGLRALAERANQVTIRYSSGALVRAPRGLSLLEGSRYGQVPHYSVCGGKGRCSTCRVRILESAVPLPPPGPIEAATLARIHADPDVRLGCQLHPAGNLTVALLMAPGGDSGLPVATEPLRPGREAEIAVLFCDLRNFTVLSETRLPYDVVFLLNRYFAIVGQAVERAGGRLDKFIGDGAMALFGLGADRAAASRQALAAAAAIIRDIDQLNDELSRDFDVRLRVAIGIHVGPSVVGVMGYGMAKGVTAIGDTVNVASRLETTAKERDAAIVISERALMQSGVPVDGLEGFEVAIRGRSASMRVFPLSAEQSRRLAPALERA